MAGIMPSVDQLLGIVAAVHRLLRDLDGTTVVTLQNRLVDPLESLHRFLSISIELVDRIARCDDVLHRSSAPEHCWIVLNP